jgi:hypothetical protein
MKFSFFSFFSNNLFLEDFKVLLISLLSWDVDLVPGGNSHSNSLLLDSRNFSSPQFFRTAFRENLSRTTVACHRAILLVEFPVGDSLVLLI